MRQPSKSSCSSRSSVVPFICGCVAAFFAAGATCGCYRHHPAPRTVSDLFSSSFNYSICAPLCHLSARSWVLLCPPAASFDGGHHQRCHFVPQRQRGTQRTRSAVLEQLYANAIRI